jgi:hypothetical protein
MKAAYMPKHKQPITAKRDGQYTLTRHDIIHSNCIETINKALRNTDAQGLVSYHITALV